MQTYILGVLWRNSRDRYYRLIKAAIEYHRSMRYFGTLRARLGRTHAALQDQYAHGAKNAPRGLEPPSAANGAGAEMKLSLYEPQNWPELLSASQVAQLLHIAPSTVGRWCEDGNDRGGPDGTVAGVWRIPRACGVAAGAAVDPG